jgi:putative flippase GtrA
LNLFSGITTLYNVEYAKLKVKRRIKMDEVIIVIPSLEPNKNLLLLLESIRKEGKELPILIVDDGSGGEYQTIFEEAKQNYLSHVLHHNVNKGKGAALKTAMQTILEEYPHVKRMVTIDSDGQHSVEDMLKCLELSQQYPDALILGTRQFAKDVPLRSRFGNILTRHILKWTTSIDIEDTQTGLRVIPREFMSELLQTNMLIETKKHNWPIYTQVITTIYIENNESSHFRVIQDSIAIYSIFIKYLFSSIASFGLDVIAYALLIRFLETINLSSIMIASILARIISAIFNYYINREIVFSKRTKNSFYLYFLLVIFQILLSGFLVYITNSILPIGNTVFWKIVVDSLLFFLSYYVQKKYIFK